MKSLFTIACAAITLMACTGNAASKGEAAAGDSTAAVVSNETLATSQVHLVGTMSDNECQIELALQMDDNFHCAGYVLYPESEPTLVAGWVDSYYGDDDEGTEYHNIRLTEYQADGTLTGRFVIHLEKHGESDAYVFSDAERTYISHSEDEDDSTAPIINVTCSGEMPEWFTESPFIPASYDDIATNYAYDLYGPDAYGEILIEKLGDGKLTFHAIDVADDSYAVNELNSAEGRPAQMQGNTFEYKDANDCGYTLSASFFKNFCVLETQQVVSDKEYCPYINTYLIKQKQ